MKFTIYDLSALRSNAAEDGRFTIFKRLAPLLLSVFALNAGAQTILEAPGLAAFKKHAPSGGGGGGGGTFTLLGHKTFNVSGSATSAAVDCTGAKLIVVSVSWFSAAASVSSSPANTFTRNAAYGGGSIYSNQVFYVSGPSVSSSMTFSASANLAVVTVSWYSYSGTSPSLDTQNGFNHGSGNITSFQTGSVTPAGNNELCITTATWNDVGSDTLASSVDSSFTITDQAESGTRSQFYGGMAYKIQTTGGSENPTWSYPHTINVASASILFFK